MSTDRARRISIAAMAHAVLASLAFAVEASACTRILWNDNSKAVLSSRSMDWEPSTSKLALEVAPRGISRAGTDVGTSKTNKVNPAIAAATRIQVTPLSLGDLSIPLALAVEDPSGDSAILQYIGGNPLKAFILTANAQ